MTEVVKQQSPSPDHHADEDTPSDPLPRQPPGSPSQVYQLRRIGAEASIKGIKDVFRLTKSRTILGRNASDVDCFVDSSIHTRLISRQHAEILMEIDENQRPVLYVLDRSLNGTFVNDVKLTSQTKVQLKEGDTLTLGHLRGVQVKQGTFAEQPNSEFRFRLVYATVDDDDDATEDEENTPSKRKNKESPKVSKKTRILHPPDSNINPPASQSTNKPYSMPPPFLQPNIRVDSNGDPSSSHQDSENNGLDEEENTKPGFVSWRGKQKRGSGKGSARGRGATSGLGRGRGSTKGSGHSRGRGRGQGDPERLEASEQKSRDTRNKAAEVFEFDSESGNEEDAILHRQIDAICDRSLSNSDSDSAKGRPGPSKPGPSKGKTLKNSRTSKPEWKRTDKKKGESGTSNQNNRKKRTSAAKKDDIEYNYLPCSSAKCIRPKNSTVSWVQCDDCDDWYHVTCVGCDYNKVKRADYQFHCGCKRKTNKK